VFKRLKLLRRRHAVDIESPEEAMALLERVNMHTSSTEDRERLAQLIRVTIEVTDKFGPNLPGRHPLPRSGLPPSPHPNANGKGLKPPGAAIGRSDLEVKDAMLKQPADPGTLSAEEGEGLSAHVHQSNLPAAVARRLEQIIRTCCGLVCALQATQMTVQRLRRLLLRPPRVQPIAMRPTRVPSSRPMAPMPTRRRLKHRRMPHPGRSGSRPKAVTASARVAWVQMLTPVRRVLSAATTSWPWGSAARWAARATSMRCRPAWRGALTAMPGSARGATREKNCAVRRAGRHLQPGCQ
jgi:hypothetical protein